jgi:hypothetical protein
MAKMEYRAVAAQGTAYTDIRAECKVAQCCCSCQLWPWLTDEFLLCCKKLGWVTGSNHHRQTDAAVASKTRWARRESQQQQDARIRIASSDGVRWRLSSLQACPQGGPGSRR